MHMTRKMVWLLAALAILGAGSSDLAMAAARSGAKTVQQKSRVVKVENQAKQAVAAKPGRQLVAQKGSLKNEAKADLAKGKTALPRADSSRLARQAPPTRAPGAMAARATREGAVRSQHRGVAAIGGKTETVRATRGGKPVAVVEAKANVGTLQKKSLQRLLVDNIDLWQEHGQLAVSSGSALVVPQDGGEPLYEKNANAVVPIASITKLMTAMVVLDSMASLQAPIAIGEEDVDYLRGSRSRLPLGAVISRETALLLALMSSENRASSALARHYPGGMPAFVMAMNRKALALGMTHTRFEDPTGLDSNNVSTAHDLAKLVAAAHRYPLIREFSTTPGYRAEVNGREIDYHNTNQLVSSPQWEIGLSKTGYIREAGKCLVMQARVAEKPVVIVLLDANGKQTRIGDANRIKRWMETPSALSRVATRV